MTIIDTSLSDESLNRYLTYALSVISGRALPDVRDGMKPVQRRILYAMLHNLRLAPSHAHRKCATVVGEVLGKYHPHGDVACYEALVRMAQDFSLRYPLVDGEGNFGSLDGDSAAAYRYTEARLRETAIDVIGEIDQETVDLRDNFDGSVQEPSVFPSRLPHLLMNGATGIAVGMATNIPPHNIKDCIRAMLGLLDDETISDAKLADLIKGPDFPTGGLIVCGKDDLRNIYSSGRGTIRVRGEWKVEEGQRGKRYIVVTSIPYAVNKSQLVERIAELIVQRKVPQLTDIRDESTTDVRIVIELDAGADAEAAVAFLLKHTALESNFAVNMTALVPTKEGRLRPEVLSLRSCLKHFIDFRHEVTRRRLEFERRQLEARIHILEGLALIFDVLDEVIKIVRKSDGRSDAAGKLQARFKLSEIQAFAVVDMRIHQLSRTNIEEVRRELAQLSKRLQEIMNILKSPKRLTALVRGEVEEMEKKYGDNRRSKIEKDVAPAEITLREEDYVVREDVYAIVTKDGWLKRIRRTNELGGTRLREGDSIAAAHAVTTLDTIVFITNIGMLYSLKVVDLPASSGYGDPVQKLLKFKDGESIIVSFALRTGEAQGELMQDPFAIREGQSLVCVSAKGIGMTTKVEGLEGLKRTGKRLARVREQDSLALVVAPPKDDLSLLTERGFGLTIKAKEIPERNPGALGVSLMGVRDDDKVVAAVELGKKGTLEVLLQSGRSKEIPAAEFVRGHRGLKGRKILSQGAIAKITSVKK